MGFTAQETRSFFQSAFSVRAVADGAAQLKGDADYMICLTVANKEIPVLEEFEFKIFPIWECLEK